MLEREAIKYASAWVTTNGNDTVNPSTVNELEARVFMLQVMLGQTIAKAQEVAGKVFDTTIAKIIGDLGSMFCLTAAELRKEMEDYNKTANGDDEHEKELYGFIERKHFVEMYVGVVASIAVPLLTCTVLPTILDAGLSPTEQTYKDALTQSKKELKCR